MDDVAGRCRIETVVVARAVWGTGHETCAPGWPGEADSVAATRGAGGQWRPRTRSVTPTSLPPRRRLRRTAALSAALWVYFTDFWSRRAEFTDIVRAPR